MVVNDIYKSCCFYLIQHSAKNGDSFVGTCLALDLALETTDT